MLIAVRSISIRCYDAMNFQEPKYLQLNQTKIHLKFDSLRL